MKKIFTLLALLLPAMALTVTANAANDMTKADAATETVVGEDNYAPAGSTFDWSFDIDFTTQKFTATVDLSTCSADNTNENVLSVGTDINAYFSNLQNAGNIHFYYTPSTKTLSCQYISSNESYGAWKYITPKTDVEGEITIDLSKQYGLRLNGEQVFNPAQLSKLLARTALHFGSLEGTTRSNATYKQARVVATEFEQTEAAIYNWPAKVLYDGVYSRFSEAKASYATTSFSECTITLPQVSVGGKVLGDITISGIEYKDMEYSGNDNPGVIYFSIENETTTVSNLGEFGTQLGLTEGQELTISDFEGYIYGVYLSLYINFTIGDKELVYTYLVDDPIQTTLTSTLKTTLNGSECSYENRVMLVSDYGDGFADITLNNIQFEGFGEMNLGNLVIKEVPYTYNLSGEQEFKAEGITATLENCPFDAMKSVSGVTINGKLSGSEAYFTVSATVTGMTADIVFGDPIVPYTVYTGKQAVYNSDSTDETDEGVISVRPAGEGKYTIVLSNVAYERALSFEATGVEGDNGLITYTAEQATAPLTASGWEGYDAYIDIVEARSQGDKFYGVFSIDRGGFAASYPYCGHTLIFGEEFTPTGIDAVNGEISAKPVQIYNVNGARMNALQRGVNIVRTADGKTVKVVKR